MPTEINRKFNSLSDHKCQCCVTETIPAWTKLIPSSPRNTGAAPAIVSPPHCARDWVTHLHKPAPWHSGALRRALGGCQRTVCLACTSEASCRLYTRETLHRQSCGSACLAGSTPPPSPPYPPQKLCDSQAVLAVSQPYNMAFACSLGYSRNTLHHTLYPNMFVALCDSWQSPGLFLFVCFNCRINH